MHTTLAYCAITATKRSLAENDVLKSHSRYLLVTLETMEKMAHYMGTTTIDDRQTATTQQLDR